MTNPSFTGANFSNARSTPSIVSQAASNTSPLNKEQTVAQVEENKRQIDWYRENRDWPALRKAYQEITDLLKNSRHRGYFSEEEIGTQLRHFLSAYSIFERDQGNLALANQLAQEIDWLAMPSSTTLRKRELERESSSQFRASKGSTPGFLDRPQAVAVNAELELLINGINQINLHQHSHLFLRTSPLLPQPFKWPISPDEITDTEHLAACLREGIKSSDSDKLRPYMELTEQILQRFGKEPFRPLSLIQEIVILVKATHNRSYHRQLIDQLQTDPERILNMAALQGLAALMQHRSNVSAPDFHLVDDCKKLLNYIHQLLKRTPCKDNAIQLSALLQTVSLLLDTLFDVGFALDATTFKDSLEENLILLTDATDTKRHMDESLAFQAEYALQALKRLRYPRELLSRLWDILKDFSGAAAYGAGAFASKDPDKFWESITKAKDGFSKIKDEWQSHYKKREWYLALYRIDKGIQLGYLNELAQFIQNWSLPKKHYLLQGLCFRLERIVLSHAETKAKEWALNFLKSLKAGEAVWGSAKDLMGVQACASATLQRIVHFWDLPTTELMERVDYAPPAWHPFWASQPQNVLLKKVRQEMQPSAIFHTLPEQFANLGQAMLCQIQLAIKQQFAALQDAQKIALQTKSSPLAILGNDIDEFKRAYQDTLEHTGELDVLSMYVPPQGLADGKNGEKLANLEVALEAFFKSKASVFLLLGAAGTGKSTFNRYLALNKLEQYQSLSATHVDPPLVFFVELRSIQDPNTQVIEQFFRSHNFGMEQIELLRTHAHQRCIFIFDGYDEIKDRNSYFYDTNKLWRWKNAKFVVTSRPEYLDDNYREYFCPANSPQALQEMWMAPFSKEQRSRYITKYVEKAQPDWAAEQYERAFSQLTALKSELQRPIVLRMLLPILPELSKEVLKQQHVKLSVVYEKYFQHWLNHGNSRLSRLPLSEAEKEAKREIAENGGFIKHGFIYIQHCALALTKNNLAMAQYDEVFNRRHPEVYAAFFRKDDKLRLLRFNAPLEVDANQQYRFSHKSMQEYLVARAIFESHCTGLNTPHETDVINQLSIVQEPVILDFLVEKIQQESKFKEYLYACIEKSKKQAAFSQGAANAITLLVRANVPFIEKNLKGIRIGGADLSYGVFDHAQLSGADLQRVNLQGAWLRCANLSGTQMKGVQIDKPSLQLTNRVSTCCYSRDGNWLAIAAGNQIILYDARIFEPIYSLRRHTSLVNSVVFSPDGSMLASGSDDCTIKLWSVNGEEEALLKTLNGHTAGINSVVFSPDGSMLASGSNDRTIRLWSVDKKSLLKTFEGHYDPVNSVVFSPDGGRLASGSKDVTVKLWSVDKKTLLKTLEGHTAGINSVVFSPDGSMLASGSDDRTIKLWSVNGEEEALLKTLKGHTAGINSVVFSPDDNMLASGGKDRTVKLWSVENERSLLKTFEKHTDWVNSVVFSPDGNMLTSGGEDRSVELWSVGDKTRLPSAFEGHTAGINSVVFSPNGKMFASGSNDRTIKLWSIGDESSLLKTFKGHYYSVRSTVFSPDGNMLASASGGDDGIINLWSVDDESSLLKTFVGHTNCVNSVVFSPNGNLLASGSNDCTVKLWSVGKRALQETSEEYANWVNSEAFSMHDNMLASNSDKHTAKLWSMSGENTLLQTLEGHTDWVNSVVFSPDGNLLASGSNDCTIKLWLVSDEIFLLKTFEKHTDSVNSVVFSPDGNMLASSGNDGTINLWSIYGEWALSKTLEGHTDWVNSVVFSPDGKMLASGGRDKIVKLWSVDSGQLLTTIEGFHGGVNALAWTENAGEYYLMTGSDDKVARLWRIKQRNGQTQVILRWASMQATQAALTVVGALIENVQGLSSMNARLLKQHGAVLNSQNLWTEK